jgi:GNAT superfamily N-acetyltransferase
MPAAARLGPHVVGVRVVVRHRLPDGRATDTLGICTQWRESSLVVDSDAGPVEIALADVVAGKPVPPRPSVRARVSPRTAQQHGFTLFPDLVTDPVGDWILRRSPTVSARRANSVLAFGPAGVPEAYERVVAHYARPIAAVLPESEEYELFRSHGWGPESNDGDTLFQLAATSRALRAAGAVPDAELEQLAPQVVRATVDGVATGVAAHDGDWVGFRGIEVDPAARRRGLGLAVMAALLDWGASAGATTAYLQVLDGNDPALALYARLGFATHHAYRYLAPS